MSGSPILAVEHLHSWGGPAESYHLTLRPYEPGFELTVLLDRFDVPQGQTLALPIVVTRRDYTGPIELFVEGPAGLTGTLTVAMGQPPANQPVQLPLKATLAHPETKEKLAGASVTLWEADQPAFKRFFTAEIEKWRGLVKKANLKFD